VAYNRHISDWPLVLGCLALFTAAAFGQNSSIQGVVTDSAGAVIPGATIKITRPDTGVAQTVTTNEVGLYVAPLLGAGQYKLECTASGFAPLERPEIQLEVGQTVRVDFQMRVGTISESIEVSAGATLLQSETSDVGQVIDSKRIIEMPLNGRNYLELAQFSWACFRPVNWAAATARRRRAVSSRWEFRAIRTWCCSMGTITARSCWAAR